MNHSRTRTRLSEYLDRKLPPEQRSKVEAHLADCAACTAELGELERTVDLLRRLPDPEPPPYLARAVMARVQAGEGRAGSPMQRLRRVIDPAFAMPVVAGLAGLILLLLVDIDVRVPTDGAAGGEAVAQAPQPSDAAERARAAARQRHSLALARHYARRGESAEVAQLLRGAGHPHSSLLATHFEHDSEIVLASW